MRIFKVFPAVVLASLWAAGSSWGAEPLKTVADGPKIPVLAWGGVPYTETMSERMKELADAGFTINFSGASNIEMMQKALDVGHAAGVQQLIALPELQKDPEGTAKRFKDHPAIAGYYLRDEPGAGLFAELGAWAKKIQSVDAKNPCYVNLFPTYGNPGQWETPTYQAYLDRFVAEVPVPMLSFDHYCVIGEDDKEAGHHLRGDYYQNLELAAAAAPKAERPLWAFALATAHNPYPVPTIPALRLQVFSNLAYGTQVMQYFTYWTPRSEVWNFHAGPIDIDGNRTPAYDRVKQVNGEMQAVRGVFLGSTVLSVAHTGDALPAGTTRYAQAAPVTAFETTGSAGAVVSLLAKGDRRFLVVVNRDLQKHMALRAAFDAGAGVQRVAKDGSVGPLSADGIKVSPGDIAIFTWVAK